MKKSPPPRALRVFVIDDHATTRLGIRQILSEEFHLAAFGEAADAASAMRGLEQGTWDLLILDITLPDRDGLQVLREVKARWLGLPVLIFSVHPEEQFALRALKAHASGYLAKERAPEELANAVRDVLAGRVYLAPYVAARLAGATGPTAPALPHENLSDREFEVMLMIARGHTGKSIGNQLRLSEKTVSTYRARVFRKMRFSGTADLIRYACANGMA